MSATAKTSDVKHNGMIKQFGVWWLIETDKEGKQWAVNGPVRLPYGQEVKISSEMLNACHAVGAK